MIEVTCGACGSTLRFADGDVPPGGKTVSCDKCKAKVALPARGMPSIPAPGVSGGHGDVINLSDLPAPKRSSALAGAPASKPAPIPPLGGRALPPKPLAKPAPPPTPKTPPPRTSALPTSPPIELDPLEMDGVDLPAPVGPEPRGGIDLPAPKRASAAPDDFSIDLPAPKPADLNSPRRAGETSPSSLDLPAPKRASGGPSPSSLDLPAPKRASGAPSSSIDLPAPKRASVGLDGGPPSLDLPTPKRASGEPAGSVDLPAPKGFFDDLPGPRSGPAGISDLPTPKTHDLPAPKGFFDDLPQSAGATPRSTDLPAPKGFFDDIPGPRGNAPPTSIAVPPGAPASISSPGRGLDLDDLDLAPPTQPPQRRKPPPTDTPIDLNPPDDMAEAPSLSLAGSGSSPAMALELEPSPDVPSLELGGSADRFSGLDLPSGPPLQIEPRAPATPPSGVVSFKASSSDPVMITSPAPTGMLDIDVDETRGPKKKATVHKDPAVAARVSAAKKAVKPSGKRRTIALVAILGVLVLGGGGFLYYRHWQKQQGHAKERAASLATARKQLAADGAGHWKRAADAASQVTAAEPRNEEALAIGAIGYLAHYLDEGTDKKARLVAADRMIEGLRAAGATGPLAQKALGLSGVVKSDLDGAVKRLRDIAGKNADDADAQLFLGWALAAARDYPGAIAAYQAAAKQKTRLVSATYALGLAQLATGDLKAALKSFEAVLAERKEHLGAQIGAAQASGGSETEIIAILESDAAKKADVRALARGWALAGDASRRAGRVDAARDRYRKAIGFDDGCVAAKIGTAQIDLAEGKLADAIAALESALEESPGEPAATLALAEAKLADGKGPEAAALLDQLAKAPLSPADSGRRSMLEGKYREASGDPAHAVESYAAAQAAFGDSDITPTIAQVTLLGKMADDARAKNDAAAATSLTRRADELLAGLEKSARENASTALTLGRAYLSVHNGAAAQTWLEVALSARKDDVEVRALLAEALVQQGKHAEAITRLREAFDLDPANFDIGVELAARYEAAGKYDEAADTYKKLTANPAVTIETRAHAGLFFARTGDPKAAAAQGLEIRKVEPKNAAGQFLEAEGLLADGKLEEARGLFKEATTSESKAVYLDGLGRASEAFGNSVDENKYRDEALVAYTEAARLDPSLLSSQLGRARLHLARREYDKALEGYEAARKLSADHSEIAYGEGMAYAATGRKQDAIKWLSVAVAKTPRADAWYQLGKLYMDLNDAGNATKAYGNATRLAFDEERAGSAAVPWLTEAYWQYGQLEENAGHDAAACKAYDSYLARNPSDQTKIRAVKTAKLRVCR